VGHKCDQGACGCAANTDCPSGKTCTGTFDGLKYCK